MAQQIAYLEAFVGADITSFRRAMSEVRSSLLDLGGVSQQLRDVGRNLTYAVTAPLLAAAGTSIALASEFDASMRNIASISTDVANNFNSFSDRVLEFGSQLRAGPVGAAEAFYEVFSAGVTNAEEAFSIAQQAAFLAEAGLTELDVTTRALITSMQAYNATAEESAHYSDVWTTMVQLGVGRMEEFVTSMGRAIPTAAALGVSFDEAGASAAFLTQRGLTVYNATTALNSAMSALLSPTDAMKSAFEELGVASGQELIDKFGGLGGAMQALYGITGDNAEAQRALFNSMQSARYAFNVFNNLPEYTQFLADFGLAVDGATGRAREQQLMSFAAQWDLLKSALSELAITIGQLLMPMITPLINNITGFLNQVSALNPELLKLGIGFLGLVAALGPALWLLGTILTPAGAFLAALTAIAGLAATNFGGFGDIFHDELLKIFPSLPQLENTIDQMMRIFSDEFDSVSIEEKGGTTTRPERIPLIERIRRALEAGVPVLGLAFQNLFDDAVNWVLDTGFPAFDELASSVLDSITGAFENPSNTKGNTPLFNTIRNLINVDIGNAIANVGGWLQEHFPQISESVTNFINTFGVWLEKEGLPTLGRIIGYVMGRFAKLVADIISGLFSGVGKENPLVTAFRDGLETGWYNALQDADVSQGSINEFAMKVIAAIATAFLAANLFGGVASNLFGTLVKALLGFGLHAVLLPVGSAIVKTLLGVISLAWTGLDTLIGTVVSNIWILVGQAFTSTVSSLSAGLKGLAPFLREAVLMEWQAIKWAGSFVAAHVSPVLLAISSAFAGALVGYAIYSAIPESTRIDIATGFWDWLADGFGSEDSYQDMENRLGLAFTDMFARIADVVLGPDNHGLWELRDSYAEAVDNITTPTEEAINQHTMNMQTLIDRLVDVYDANDGKGLGAIAGSLATVVSQIQWNWMTIKDNMVQGVDGTWIYVGPELEKLGDNMQRRMTETFVKSKDAVNTGKTNVHNEFNDLIQRVKASTDSTEIQLKRLVAAFNIQSVTLPTDPFVNALNNLRSAIQPIIDGIISAWNSMLALVGQQVTIPTPAPQTGGGNTGGNTGGNSGGNSGGNTGGGGHSGGGGGGGHFTPTYATGGLLAAGRAAMVERDEIIVPTRPAMVLPKSYNRGGIGGTVIHNEQFTIVANDPDVLIDQLRRRGYDMNGLKRGKR